MSFWLLTSLWEKLIQNYSKHTCGFLMCWRIIVNWTESIVFHKGNKKKIKWQQLSFLGGWACPFFKYNPSPCWFKQWSRSYSMQFHEKYFTCNKRSFWLCKAVTGENLGKVISRSLGRVVVETAVVLLCRDLFLPHMKWDLRADKW